ncbi:hypothetical protein [Planomicrobium sp. CPCC 101079]|uniref:hypothetical protein n=1 Tax=Planomicrobium sp. CPCC 101079 TaxID=2599618 RepID=UPI0011B7E712|nr:hypothetical protein [Planomicrobium sp. CPCC 101079]TWT00147.1 hypothetical protein FQV28_18695 [Planomicrobium sp. CPCC 101079]
MTFILTAFFFSLVEDLNSKVQIQGIVGELKGDFDTFYQKMKKERGNIEIKKSNGHHDRYIIIDRKNVYMTGSSLNRLGNKPSLIIPIENKRIKESILNYFDETWQGNSGEN